MHTTYTFKKDGQSYHCKANNLVDAKDHIELTFGISLKGCEYEERYKLRTVRKGIIRF